MSTNIIRLVSLGTYLTVLAKTGSAHHLLLCPPFIIQNRSSRCEALVNGIMRVLQLLLLSYFLFVNTYVISLFRLK